MINKAAQSTAIHLHAAPIGARGLAVVGAGIGALVFVMLRPLLGPGANVLPGTDASNLYAWELYARSVFALGRLPHWNPFLFAGTPHLADSETTVLYPAALLLRWIPAAPFFSWMVAFHLCAAGIGTAFLARVLALGWVAVAAAAIAVTFGGSVPAWIFNGHLLLLFATAWLPWVLGLMIYSARRPTLWPHPGLVVVLVVQFLAGYLQGTIYVAAATAVCVVWLVAVPSATSPRVSRLVPLWQLAIAGLLAAGIGAFQLLPTLTLVGEAERTAGLPYSTAVRGGWTLQDLATFLFPFAGIPAESRMRFMGDHTAYVGWVLVLAIPFAFAGRSHRRIAALFGVLAAGCIAFVLSGALPFYRIHFLLFPGLRIPGRMLFVATLAVAMLGATGVDWLMRRMASGNRPVARVAALLLLLLVAGDVLRYSRGAVQATSPDPAPALFAIPAAQGRTLSTCDRALGPMDLVIGGRPAADGTGGGVLRDYATFQELALEDGPLRLRRDLLDLSNITTVITCAPIEAPGLREVGHASVGIVYRNETAWPRAIWTCGVESMSRRDAIELLRDVRYDAQRRLDRRHFVNIRWAASVTDAARLELEARYHLGEGVRRDGATWRYDLQDLHAANIQKLLAEPAIEDTHGINREAAALSSADTQDQVLIGTATCAQSGAITALSADRPGGDVTLVSEAPTSGFVFLSEPYYPERVAFVDQTAVAALKADVAFTAVPVPAGRHVIELRYVPRRFQTGLVVSVVTLTTWVVAAWWLPRRRRSSSTSTSA